ncbi:RuBisCO large subunit C-terminal-like domain-containing protein [Rhodomicrobium lacus]|uniref:RuBisCO large subunit C-terminal-like domain-containing protein n=1 Tax=Rhodomicrobium lacus TaxID=2498452 RepID=UPI0026E25C60|nr:RuBisCO large subunit C-terminal-like domain-containing protein [Rhodomicrobium lacus]WKW51127.1 RuBisCO large subunit C-terminal-like domain-containing protein [Rhodomicrobium lacus]
MSRLSVTYQVRSDAASIEARAAAIAVEQSVEMPLDAIADAGVLRDIVGEVQGISEAAPGLFEVRIGLAVDTTGYEAGQLLNMLFGNSSIMPDVTLVDAEIPEAMARAFGGPNVGIGGLREKAGSGVRALTCTALKPQGLSPDELGALAARLAAGGIDFIKDDHGLADQIYSPFADRVRAVASAVREMNAKTGHRTLYAPNVSGSFDQAADQIALAEAEGGEAVLVEPMLIGVSNFHRLTRLFPNVAFIAHPAMAGAARIAPPFLLGTLFRLFGADVTIYPNYGGRFSYSPETCRAIAQAARRPWGDIKPCFPCPAGGMTLQRVDELLDFYGADTMFLIGGSLLAARERITDEAAAFQARVVRHFEGSLA